MRRTMTDVPVLGLDVGGVLVDRAAENADTSFFGDRPMDTPMVTGALTAVRRLSELFEGRVFVVSKAGPKISELTRRWLGVKGFMGTGMIDPDDVYFVRTRLEKAPICETLGVSHFVDDRLDVLGHLLMVRARYLFTGGLGRHDPPSRVPRSVVVVGSWAAAANRIETDLRWGACR